jgi:hypothetical protein
MSVEILRFRANKPGTPLKTNILIGYLVNHTPPLCFL